MRQTVSKDLNSTTVIVPGTGPIPPVPAYRGPLRRKRPIPCPPPDPETPKDELRKAIDDLVLAVGDSLGIGTIARVIERVIAKVGGDPGTYVGRLLQNGPELAAWLATAQIPGVSGKPLDDNMHVTIAHSVRAFEADHADNMVRAHADAWGVLGKDRAVVLYLDSPDMVGEHNDTNDAGAQWDHPMYRPHLTLFYLPPGADMTLLDGQPQLPPFPLVFGPHITSPLGRDAFAKAIAKAAHDVSEEARAANGQWQEGDAPEGYVRGIHYGNDVFGSSHGQLDGQIQARGPNGSIGATLDYSVFEGDVHIKMIDVHPTIRRMGVATAMMDKLKAEYPNAKIHTGMTTPDGTPFVAAYERTRGAMAKSADVSGEARDDHGKWTRGGGDDVHTSWKTIVQRGTDWSAAYLPNMPLMQKWNAAHPFSRADMSFASKHYFAGGIGQESYVNNGKLRDAPNRTAPQYDDRLVRQWASSMDAEFEASPYVLNPGTAVYRGFGKQLSDQLSKGTTLTDNGYTSTSESYDWAAHFGRGLSTTDGWEARIEVEHPTRVLANPREAEIVLPRGTQYTVIDIDPALRQVALRARTPGKYHA